MEISHTMRVILRNPEFQSSVVRLAIWCFSVVYIGLGSASDHYKVDEGHYQILFGGFLVVFIGLLTSVFLRPEWPARRYFSLVIDISAVSLCIFLTQEAIGPFFLLYIWIFLSYGTRYGSAHLRVASILSIVTYAALLVILDQWAPYKFEAIFFLLLLILLPFYQFMLLRKLHQARLEAEQSDQAKSAFLSSMTHELRTPLSGILGMSNLLSETHLTSDQREYVHSITSSAHNLDTLIGDVLDLSCIEAAGLELKNERVNLSEFMREVAITTSNQALDKKLELICLIDATVPEEVIIDPLRLRQVLLNLLSNGIKFTHHGEIELSVKLQVDADELAHRYLLFKVKDTGIGLSEQQQQQVFERFWQADNSATTHHGGAGLGVSIAQTLVHCMEGTIGVESEPQIGSTFWVKLPLQVRDGLDTRVTRSQAPHVGGAVLIIESNEKLMTGLVQSCQSVGITTYTVNTIMELGDVINHVEALGGIDFAIVADSPGGVDVFRVAKVIRQHLNESLPVIYAGYRGRPLSETGGNSRFLIKPVTKSSLLAVIETLRKSPKMEDRHPPRRATQVDVLMAEDNAINAKVLLTLLEELGCSVQWAKDGAEALQLVLQKNFDIAFVDLRMPKLDGYSFTRDYRATENGLVHLPIIALTANTMDNVYQECMDAGMDDFLAKPVDSQVLSSVLKRYVGVT